MPVAPNPYPQSDPRWEQAERTRRGELIRTAPERLGKFLFGDENNPGAFGTGRFRPNEQAGQIGGADEMADIYRHGAATAGGRVGPQGEFRTRQAGLADSLDARTRGEGPSVAQSMLQRATDRNIAQAYALGSSLGGNQAAARRGIASNAASVAQQAVGDASQLRAQEITQAQNQLAQVLAGARGQDIGQQQQNDDMVRFYLGMGLSLAEARQRAAMDVERIRFGAFEAQRGGNQQATGAVLNAAGQAASAAAGMPPVPVPKPG